MDFKELEKQLGIESDESKEDLDKLNKELDDLMELLDSDEDGIIKIDDEDISDINEENIEELLKKDEEMELEDIDTEAMNDISTYDLNSEELTEEDIFEDGLEIEEDEENEEIEEDQEEDEEEEEIDLASLQKEIKKRAVPTTVFIYGIVVFLIFCIILSAMFFKLALDRVNQNNLEKEIEREKERVKAALLPSEHNAAYLGIAQSIDGIPLTLDKILVDPLYLKLYIKSTLNLMNYKVSLTDNSGNLYSMDTNFIKVNDGEIELKFNRNKLATGDYTLKIESISTGKKAECKFTIPNNLDKSEEVKYINNIKKMESDGFTINLTGGNFSSSGSSIYYTLEPNKDSNFKIKQQFINEVNSVKLAQNGRNVESVRSTPLLYNMQDGIVLGRMDFDSIPTNSEDVVITFDNLYKSYPLNKTLSLEEVNSGNIVFEFDKYKLFLEGMPRFDDKIVLVLHCEDTTISTENRREDFNRVEVLVDPEIYIENNQGVSLVLKPSSSKSAYYGTDIVFEMDKQQTSLLNTISASNVKLKLNSVLMKTEKVHIPINLNVSMNRKIIEDEHMTKQIKEAFISRLDYTYNGNNNIKGFSSDVLNNEKLIIEYQKLPQAKNPKYNVNIISKKLENDTLYAVVQDVVKYELQEKEIIIYRNHKIKATYSEGIWTIISDEVIK